MEGFLECWGNRGIESNFAWFLRTFEGKGENEGDFYCLEIEYKIRMRVVIFKRLSESF